MRPLGELLDNAEKRNWLSVRKYRQTVSKKEHQKNKKTMPEGDSELPDDGLPEDQDEE